MAKNNQPKRQIKDNNSIYSQQSEDRFVVNRYSNVQSDLIEVTHDKLENILSKHLSKLSISKAWITPLSIGVTLLITILTTSFNKTFGIGADVWKALFILCFLACCVWFIYTIINYCRHRDKLSIEHIIESIKNANAKEPNTNKPLARQKSTKK